MNFNQKLLYFLPIFALALFFFFGYQQYSNGNPNPQAEALSKQKAVANTYQIKNPDIPEDIHFAGEPVPLYDPEVKERLERELKVNTYWQSQTLLFLKRAPRFFELIEPILEKYNIPDDFKYLSLIESGFMNVVSPAGAAGIWQFLEGTAKEYGLRIQSGVDERFHFEKSTEAAALYLQDAYHIFENWTLVAAAYNMGMGGVKGQLNRQRTNNYYDLYLNPETSRYVFRILAIKIIMENPENYGFYVDEEEAYPSFNAKKVLVKNQKVDWYQFSEDFSISYKYLKHYNPWIRSHTLENNRGDTFMVNIPKDIFKDTVSFQPQSVPFNFQKEELNNPKLAPLMDKSEEEVLEEYFIHKVKARETIGQIAEKYGVSVAAIMQWNNLEAPYVKRNQSLKIYQFDSNKE